LKEPEFGLSPSPSTHIIFICKTHRINIHGDFLLQERNMWDNGKMEKTDQFCVNCFGGIRHASG
jgi:hypothetical protein